MNQFCVEPFDEKSITHQDRDLSFKECANDNKTIVYCRKLTQIGKNILVLRTIFFFNIKSIFFAFFLTVNNETAYSRACHWKPVNAPKEECYDSTPLPSFVKNVNCELCNVDGCNHATQFGPIALLFMIPIAVARSFQL